MVLSFSYVQMFWEGHNILKKSFQFFDIFCRNVKFCGLNFMSKLFYVNFEQNSTASCLSEKIIATINVETYKRFSKWNRRKKISRWHRNSCRVQKKCKSHLKFNLKINISLNEQQFHVANFDFLLSSRKTFV